MNLRPLLSLCAAGVGLRLLFLFLAGNPEFQSDEANYVYLALVVNHFGHYQDGFRFLWPPRFAFVIAARLALFGRSGLPNFGEYAGPWLRPSALAPERVKAAVLDALRASFRFPEEPGPAESEP